MNVRLVTKFGLLRASINPTHRAAS
jgi:hypothetical protein